jgi:hypothetical protein
MVTWSKSHPEDSQFWSDTWTSLLSGALCFRKGKKAVTSSRSAKFSCPADLAPGICAPLFDMFKEVCHVSASGSPFFAVTPLHLSFSHVLCPTHGVTLPYSHLSYWDSHLLCHVCHLRVAGTLTDSAQCDQFAQHSSCVCSFMLHLTSCNRSPSILGDTLLWNSLPLLWIDTYFQTPFTFFFCLYAIHPCSIFYTWKMTTNSGECN